VNCIFWNNSPQEVEFNSLYDPNTITIAYSDIDGGEEGIVTNNNGTVNWLEGNIDTDPLFVDAEMGNYYLNTDSPCIDTGITYFEYEGEVLVDLSEDGYWGIAPDMGAYEYEGDGSLTAEFVASDTMGYFPLEVQFTDFSFGDPVSWEWDFENDGEIDSYEQNPVLWVYDEPGIYSVNLTVSDDVARETSTELKEDYITVLEYRVHNITQDICYETIQEGIDDSNNGDIVLVETGIYEENINFEGKAVILGSFFYTTLDTSYISQTIIDGNQNGSVVTFESEENSTSVLTGFTITNGHADYGGGIYCSSSSPSLANVTITDNSAGGSGGGIYCSSSSPSLENVTIMNNSAYRGGGIYCSSSSPSLENVTIMNNSSESSGGGIFCFHNSSPSLVNCISWSNLPQEVEFYDSYDPNTITIAYSDIDGGEEGIVTNNNGTVNWLEGNIDTDPLFVDAEMGNYYLNLYSPCIDTGIAYFEYEGEVLVDLSEDEYWGIAPDMGAYEYEEDGSLTAKFVASDTTGYFPMEVQFTDFSFGDPVSWEWDFENDGEIDSYEQNPVFWVYDEPGIYSVSLTVSDEVARDTSTELKVDYITVLEYPVHNITQDICYGTIQEGIDDSNNGDIVLVEPGIYVENINFNGKAVILGSLFYTTQDTSYISQTIIDGNQDGSVVTFESEEGSTSVLTGFTITNGQGVGYPDYTGGGITCINFSCPSLENVTITDNSAGESGGGIYCGYSSPILENVTITGNSADYGGGVSCYFSSSPILENVTITGNSASNSFWGGGGGIYCWDDSSPSLENVTITDNSAGRGGGICCACSSSPSLVNCIFWNNSPQEVEFLNYSTPNTITIAYSDIDGGEEGIETNNNGTVNWVEGNIDADPLFEDAEMGNYHLTEDSPCIDTGTSYFEYEGEVLVDLSLDEYLGFAPDMGAYEYGMVATDEFEIENVKCKINNYPNPFNPETNIVFELSFGSNVLIEIYNIKGQKVTTLVNNRYKSGRHQLTWNAENRSSGIYLMNMKANGVTRHKKLILLK